jgi:3-oxoacyl-[acyl-carrier protein] reductase
MDLRLEDKRILVTAASRGLGYGVAEALIREKANVVICGRSEDSLKAAVARLGERASYHVADVSSRQDVENLIHQLASTESTLDGLFVNAGGPPPGTFSNLTDQDWEQSFGLTLMSAVWLTRMALPLLEKSHSPSILYSTSISVKQPIDNLLLSNSLRPAVIGLMKTLSTELGSSQIRVNAVCPGYIRTERVRELLSASDSAEGDVVKNIPLGRIGTPEEFGALCAFLLSPLASYIHGSLILIDVGMYKGMM